MGVVRVRARDPFGYRWNSRRKERLDLGKKKQGRGIGKHTAANGRGGRGKQTNYATPDKRAADAGPGSGSGAPPRVRRRRSSPFDERELRTTINGMTLRA